MVHLIIGLRKVEDKRLNYLKDLVRKIVVANQKLDDIPDLETEESATERHQ